MLLTLISGFKPVYKTFESCPCPSLQLEVEGSVSGADEVLFQDSLALYLF